MCWQQQQALTPESSAPGFGRSTMAKALTERLGTDDWAEGVQFDAAVIVTELIANAVQAGSTRVTMSVQAHRSHVRLTVSDDAAGLPRVMAAGPDDLHGRGLTLVTALARAWGVDVDAQGKAVWADVAIPPDAFAGNPLAWCDEPASVGGADPAAR